MNETVEEIMRRFDQRQQLRAEQELREEERERRYASEAYGLVIPRESRQVRRARERREAKGTRPDPAYL